MWYIAILWGHGWNPHHAGLEWRRKTWTKPAVSSCSLPGVFTDIFVQRKLRCLHHWREFASILDACRHPFRVGCIAPWEVQSHSSWGVRGRSTVHKFNWLCREGRNLGGKPASLVSTHDALKPLYCFHHKGIPHGRVQRDTLADIWTSVTAVEPLIPWRHWGQIVRRPVPVEKVEICPHRDQGWLVLALRCLAIGSQVVQYPVLFQMPSNIQTGTVSVHGLYRSCSMGAAPIYPCAICCNNVETWPNMSLDRKQTAGFQSATFPVLSSSHWWDLPDPASL